MIATASFLQERDNSKPNREKYTYWQHLGMNQAPFASSLQYAMYYPVPKWQAHINTLQSMHLLREQLLIVTAKTGSGKSMLLAQFIAQTDDLQIHKLNTDSKIRIPELLDLIRKGFQLPINNLASTWQQQLNKDLLAISARKQPHILIIDEAHLLPAESLAMLANIAYAQHKDHICLHIILAGEPLLRERLINLPELQEEKKIPSCIELEPLTLEDTKNYIKTRLAKSGYTDVFPFDDVMMNDIFHSTNGIPHLINEAAQTMLKQIEKYKRKKPKTKKQTTTKTKEQTTKKTDNQEITKGVMAQLAQHKIKLISIVLLSGAIIWLWLNGTNPSIQQSREIRLAQALKSQQQSIFRQPLKAIMASHKIQAKPAVIKTPPVSQQINIQKQAAIQKPQVVTTQQPTAPLLAAQQPIVNQPAIVQQPKPPLQIAQQPISKPTKPMPPLLAAANPAPEDTYNGTEQQLLHTKGYTIQLLGLHSADDLKSFVATHNLDHKATFYHTRYKNKNWFVLLYGHYATRDEAQAALKQLPKELQKLKPWIRPFSMVHTAIQNQTIG